MRSFCSWPITTNNLGDFLLTNSLTFGVCSLICTVRGLRFVICLSGPDQKCFGSQMCCLNHRTLYLLMCVLLTCFFLFIGNNSSERTQVFCWEMVLGLARGKSNSGEAEITQETACMRSQRMWPLKLGENGGPNCPTLFCLGLRADEKWVCVNTRPVREGYYNRVWLERLSPRLRSRERGNFFHSERRRILLKIPLVGRMQGTCSYFTASGLIENSRKFSW